VELGAVFYVADSSAPNPALKGRQDPELNISLEGRALANGGIAQTGNIGNALGTPAMLAVVATGADTGLPALLIGCYASAIIVHLALARGRANAERCSAPKS